MKFIGAALAFFAASAAAYSPSRVIHRREMFQSFVSAGAAAAVVAHPSFANALEACPKGAKNCIRTEWTPPSGFSKDEIISSLRKVLDSYPQQGQQSVDLGGWQIAEDFSNGAATARVEFKSGIGNFAKFLNGGKPFVDDLKLELGDGVVQVKSASRVGDSDFGVNQKRLNYLVAKLREEGWNAPDPVY